MARGELVEIGDGFRIPDLLTASGARLREVGTTNRVHLDDYAAAITDSTALVLKVHPSNFTVAGFTTSVGVAELATLPVPVVVDIGSGLLTPHPRLPGRAGCGQRAARRSGARDRLGRQAPRRTAGRPGPRLVRPGGVGCGDTRSPAPSASTS